MRYCQLERPIFFVQQHRPLTPLSRCDAMLAIVASVSFVSKSSGKSSPSCSRNSRFRATIAEYSSLSIASESLVVRADPSTMAAYLSSKTCCANHNFADRSFLLTGLTIQIKLTGNAKIRHDEMHGILERNNVIFSASSVINGYLFQGRIRELPVTIHSATQPMMGKPNKSQSSRKSHSFLWRGRRARGRRGLCRLCSL